MIGWNNINIFHCNYKIGLPIQIIYGKKMLLMPLPTFSKIKEDETEVAALQSISLVCMMDHS